MALRIELLVLAALLLNACGDSSSTRDGDASPDVALDLAADGTTTDVAEDPSVDDPPADAPIGDGLADARADPDSALSDSGDDPGDDPAADFGVSLDVDLDVGVACERRLVGVVHDATRDNALLEGARVTLQALSDDAVREVRSDVEGRFAFDELTPTASYRVGASSRGLAFRSQEIVATEGCLTVGFDLAVETHPGQWQSLGNPGEAFGGTNSGVLLPDGRTMFCHDTIDPVIFDPLAEPDQRFTAAAESPRLQGCHAVTLTADGNVMYVGGTDQPVYGPGTRQVKLYDPVENQWTALTDPNQLVDPRWYPSLAPLPDGGYVAVGGGGLDNPERLSSSEVLDPETGQWRAVDDVALGNEVSPVVLLFTGEVLMTHRPPQLYNPDDEEWRLAGDFVQADRMANGDHADHEIVMLSDGRVVAVGFKSFVEGEPGRILEIYDPVEDEWSLGAPVDPVRSRASILLLPDQRVLVLGGQKEDASDPTPTNAWNYTALTDLYDPATDSWRRLEDLSVAREYHAMPILLPDGRVVVTGGEGAPGVEPPQSVVEVYSPPYLFRGPRPQLTELSETTFEAGDSFSFEVSGTNRPTAVVLIGAIATTHFMESGPGRYIELAYEVDGSTVTATVPAQPARAIPGYYVLFAMVDDIPSPGVMVRVDR